MEEEISRLRGDHERLVNQLENNIHRSIKQTIGETHPIGSRNASNMKPAMSGFKYE